MGVPRHSLQRPSVKGAQTAYVFELRIFMCYASPKVVEDGRKPYLPNWFPGARLNYAENLLSRNDDSIAVTAARETGDAQHYTWRELRRFVAEVAAGLRKSGIRVGDRVAGMSSSHLTVPMLISLINLAIVTNHITAVTLALGTAAVGAIFSPTATDMGTQGILERYRQIRPTIVFAETEVVYSGKPIDLIPKVRTVAQDLLEHGLRRVVLLPSVLRESVREDHNVPAR